jgi:hypothetical protein
LPALSGTDNHVPSQDTTRNPNANTPGVAGVAGVAGPDSPSATPRTPRGPRTCWNSHCKGSTPIRCRARLNAVVVGVANRANPAQPDTNRRHTA